MFNLYWCSLVTLFMMLVRSTRLRLETKSRVVETGVAHRVLGMLFRVLECPIATCKNHIAQCLAPTWKLLATRLHTHEVVLVTWN